MSANITFKTRKIFNKSCTNGCMSREDRTVPCGFREKPKANTNPSKKKGIKQ